MARRGHEQQGVRDISKGGGGSTTATGENVSEIQALTDQVRDLSQSTDQWNNAMVWALVLGALSAIAVVLTTSVALRCAKQLALSQSELLRAKDNQLALDLRDRDVKISDAKRKAGEANKEAGDARKESAEISMRAATLEKEAAQLRKQLNEQGRRAHLLNDGGPPRDKFVERIRSFAGQKAVLLINPNLFADSEMMELSNVLAGSLSLFGRWAVTVNALVAGGPGVWVIISPEATPETAAAARALRKALDELRLTGNKDVEFPSADVFRATDAHTVVILVGTHP
jgi:hypothetical protein